MAQVSLENIHTYRSIPGHPSSQWILEEARIPSGNSLTSHIPQENHSMNDYLKKNKGCIKHVSISPYHMYEKLLIDQLLTISLHCYYLITKAQG